MADKKQGKPTSAPAAHGAAPAAAAAIHCKVKGCKHSPSKFDFCAEHFDQFKFGLINKNGEHAMDFEKKEEQYAQWKKAKKTA